MTDKERILTAIVTTILPAMPYSNDRIDESTLLYPEKLQKGDLVLARTSFEPNDFSVGFVSSVETNYVVIREIGSNRLCNYYNEGFVKINKAPLGYQILEGMQYQIYEKVEKAFHKYILSNVFFKSIVFSESDCTVQARKPFKDETYFTVTFPYSSRTTIKQIGKILTTADAQTKAEETSTISIKAEESKLFKRGDAIIYHGSNGLEDCKCFFGNYNEDGTCNIYNGWDLTHVPLTCIAKKIDDSLQT